MNLAEHHRPHRQLCLQYHSSVQHVRPKFHRFDRTSRNEYTIHFRCGVVRLAEFCFAIVPGIPVCIGEWCSIDPFPDFPISVVVTAKSEICAFRASLCKLFDKCLFLCIGNSCQMSAKRFASCFCIDSAYRIGIDKIGMSILRIDESRIRNVGTNRRLTGFTDCIVGCICMMQPEKSRQTSGDQQQTNDNDDDGNEQGLFGGWFL